MVVAEDKGRLTGALRENIAVIVDYSDLPVDKAKELFIYMQGFTSGIGGRERKIAPNVLMYSGRNVDLKEIEL